MTANKDIVRVGDDLELRCDVAGEIDPFVRWHKVGGMIEPNVDIEENILRMRSVVPDNGGTYRCVTTARGGTYEDDYDLEIERNFINRIYAYESSA